MSLNKTLEETLKNLPKKYTFKEKLGIIFQWTRNGVILEDDFVELIINLERKS